MHMKYVSSCKNRVYNSIFVLMVQAAGTPTPEVLWFKNEAPVQIKPGHIGIFNDGTELRISGLQNSDIGDYTCIARNGEGRIHHTTYLVKAGKLLDLYYF